MCGIAGVVSARPVEEHLLRAMTGRISHRGPDDSGLWQDSEAGVHLGHRRLSIVDLSPSGHQPMASHNGRYILVFNGEIYNHEALRSEVQAAGGGPGVGKSWCGHSDTETLLEAVALWGLKRALEKGVGMFALALWDRQERQLHLARDRFGEKPLYYGWAGRDFVFASELKALRVHPEFDNPISREALGLFAARTYVPAPLSIYEHVFKVEPGFILTVNRDVSVHRRATPPEEGRVEAAIKLERYWSYRQVIEEGLTRSIDDEAAALDELERTLAAAIRSQAVADVPVGAFLSGGIDSSTVVALYQKYSSKSVRTFSIGFEQKDFNEAPNAKKVAEYLGTVHNEHYVTVEEARNVIPLLPSMYDEPFADSSQIPSYLVSRFAREQVTVALTGDGGDELFAGYNRHFAAPQLWEKLQRMPRRLRSAGARPLARVPTQVWSSLAVLKPGRRQPHFGAKIQKAFRVAARAGTFDDVYHSFLDEWSFETSPVMGVHSPRLCDLDVDKSMPDSLRMMYYDAITYLPDDILAKVDRASMAVSLETRAPFLDHRVADLAARIPLGLKIRGGRGKYILRQLLYGLVPRGLVDRPKAGFAIPIGHWIKGPLRPWAEELMDEPLMRRQGFFDPAIVRGRWREHLSGQRDSAAALWPILMFQAWLKEQQQQRSSEAA